MNLWNLLKARIRRFVPKRDEEGPLIKRVIEPRNYLLIDEELLNQTFEQLASSTVFDKVQQIGVDGGIASLAVKTQQSRFPRQLTKIDKVSQVTNLLKESNVLGNSPFLGAKTIDESRQNYRLHSIKACRVIFPKIQNEPALAMWVARYGPRGWSQLVILIENQVGIELDGIRYSGYSYLALVLAKRLKGLIEVPNLLVSNWGSQTQSLDQDVWIEDLFKLSSEELTVDPFGYFRERGARIMPEREITCLYLLRDFLMSTNTVDGVPVTIGYPLFISAATPRESEAISKLEFCNQTGLIPYSNDYVLENVRLAAGRLPLDLENQCELKDAVFRERFMAGQDILLARAYVKQFTRDNLREPGIYGDLLNDKPTS